MELTRADFDRAVSDGPERNWIRATKAFRDLVPEVSLLEAKAIVIRIYFPEKIGKV